MNVVISLLYIFYVIYICISIGKKKPAKKRRRRIESEESSDEQQDAQAADDRLPDIDVPRSFTCSTPNRGKKATATASTSAVAPTTAVAQKSFDDSMRSDHGSAVSGKCMHYI